MKLNQDSITVNMVVKTVKSVYPDTKETSIEMIQKLIESGNFTAEYIPASFTTQSTGTLIITEKS